MVNVGCTAMVEVLNVLFGSDLILNDGHEILAQLQAGDELADIAGEVGAKFGNPARVEDIRRVTSAWPDHHQKAVSQMLQWALSTLDTEERITVKWKGDDEHPETVTRFELRDHTLTIEFAHPPVGSRTSQAGVSS